MRKFMWEKYRTNEEKAIYENYTLTTRASFSPNNDKRYDKTCWDIDYRWAVTCGKTIIATGKAIDMQAAHAMSEVIVKIHEVSIQK